MPVRLDAVSLLWYTGFSKKRGNGACLIEELRRYANRDMLYWMYELSNIGTRLAAVGSIVIVSGNSAVERSTA